MHLIAPDALVIVVYSTHSYTQLDDSKSSSASKLSIDSLGGVSARDSFENALDPNQQVAAQRAHSNAAHAQSQPPQRPGTFVTSASVPANERERERANAAAGFGAPGPQRRHISQSKSVSAVSREADSGLLVLESDPDAISRPPVSARPEKTKSIV